MPENTPPAGQVPGDAAATPGQVPTPSSGTPPTPGQVPSPSAGDDLTADQLRDALKRANEQAAKSRIDAKRLAELEKAEADRQAASLSETQKIAKRADEAEAALKAARGRIGAAELKVAASALGIIDPDIAAALLGSKVEYDGDGEPTNVAELVKQLKGDKPHLFAGAPAAPTTPSRPAANSGGATNPGRQAGNGGLTIEMIRAMPMRERMARMDEIRAWEKAQQS